jgi:hypothetical protein
MFRIGIDGVTEQHELKHRNAQHHRERQPVAPHLDKFLRDDGAKPLPVECEPFHESVSSLIVAANVSWL